jgi:hypothetical protein
MLLLLHVSTTVVSTLLLPCMRVESAVSSPQLSASQSLGSSAGGRINQHWLEIDDCEPLQGNGLLSPLPILH